LWKCREGKVGFAEREIGVDGGVGGVARERWATRRELTAKAATAIAEVQGGGGSFAE